jgi:hypothetical protein
MISDGSSRIHPRSAGIIQWNELSDVVRKAETGAANILNQLCNHAELAKP